MKIFIGIALFVITMFSFIEQAHAIEITAPKEGEIFNAGSTLDIIVKPSAGEDWAKVYYYLNEMDYSLIFRQYRATLKIPANLLGYQELSISAVDKLGHAVELKRKIFVKLPPNVVLKGIEVNPSPLFLEKLPLNSLPDDIRVFGTKNLKVMGVYSDGVKRKLVDSASGTTYTSSNDKVVTVEPDGKAVAQGVGKARITVRNGRVSVDVRVIIDPYKE